MFRYILLLTILILSVFKLSATEYYKTTVDLNVRSGPGKSSSVIFKLDKFTEVELISKEENWSVIKYRNEVGYASNKYLVYSRTSEDPKYNKPLLFELNSHNIAFIIAILMIVSALIIFFINLNDDSVRAANSSIYSNNNNSQTIPNVIVIKSSKSVGVSILLVLIFGPIGLFYSSVLGGMIMTLLCPIILATLLFSGNWASAILFIVIYWPICLIWAIVAASSSKKNVIKIN